MSSAFESSLTAFLYLANTATIFFTEFNIFKTGSDNDIINDELTYIYMLILFLHYNNYNFIFVTVLHSFT